MLLQSEFPKWFWPGLVVASLAVHAVTFAVMDERAHVAAAKPQPVKVRIVEVKKEEPKKEEAPPPKPPEPPKPKPKPKEPKKVATERPKPVDPKQPPPVPVQGLSADAMTPGGKVAAPLGNTQMMEDTGKRLKEAPPPMDTDLSADAKLIADSIVTPQYTDAALDANFEGAVAVEVLVDEAGKVSDAELKKKVGYGMDDRILAAVRGARFVPRKNKLGRPEAGWTEIRFTLQIP